MQPEPAYPENLIRRVYLNRFSMSAINTYGTGFSSSLISHPQNWHIYILAAWSKINLASQTGQYIILAPVASRPVLENSANY